MASRPYLESQTYSASLGGTVYNVSVGFASETDFSGVYNVKAYGAIGDGVTDDTAAIQAAIDACVASDGGTVMFPDGHYIVASTLTVDRGASLATDRDGGITLDVGTAVIEAPVSMDTAILRVGATAHINRNVHVLGGSFKYAAENWDAGATCVEFLNTYNSRLINSRVRHGFHGVRLRASDGQGCVYNMIEGVQVTDCLNAFQLRRDSSTSWVNENTVLGGRCEYTSGMPDASAGYAISLTSDTEAGNTTNNNKFIGVALENSKASDKPTCVFDEFGVYTSFQDIRYEGFDTPFHTFGTNTYRTMVSGGYLTSKLQVAAESDQPKVMIMMPQESFITGGSSSIAALTVINANSSSNTAIEIRNATNADTQIELKSDGIIQIKEGAHIQSGSNSPEGVHAADVGSIFLRTNGGAGTSFYVKETGTGNTGWVGK